MPTAVPIRSQHAAAVERLSWPSTAQFVILLLRVRWLNRRLEVVHLRAKRDGIDAAGPALLLTARRWLAVHEAIGSLLGTPEPPEVSQMRAMLQRPKPDAP